MRNTILSSFIVLLAACGARASSESAAPPTKLVGDADEAPSTRETASEATREQKAGTRDARVEPSPMPTKSAPALRLVLEREGVALARDGSGLVLEPLDGAEGEPSAGRNDAPQRPRLFLRMPSSGLQRFGEAAAP